MVLWSPAAKLVYVMKLIVPWEEGVKEAYERKKNKYTDLAAEASQNGWEISIFLVEVGCRGSTTSRLVVDWWSTEEHGDEGPLSPTGYQDCIWCCRKKQQLALDQAQRQKLGPVIDADVHRGLWRVRCRGGNPWKLGTPLSPLETFWA